MQRSKRDNILNFVFSSITMVRSDRFSPTSPSTRPTCEALAFHPGLVPSSTKFEVGWLRSDHFSSSIGTASYLTFQELLNLNPWYRFRRGLAEKDHFSGSLGTGRLVRRCFISRCLVRRCRCLVRRHLFRRCFVFILIEECRVGEGGLVGR
jgi:hypothetical protein